MLRSSTNWKILTQLADGRFHSGEAIAGELGVSRAAIWKAVQKWQALGVSLQKVRGKGYRIVDGLELLQRDSIMTAIPPAQQAFLDEIIILPSIDSTNDYLLERAKQAPQRRLACLAEMQTQARGRRERSWSSPFGRNIYLSLLWHIQKDPGELMGLSLAVAVIICRALADAGLSQGIQVKWPNDILWQQRKLAGILIDMLAQPHAQSSVVIGIGLNTYQADTLEVTDRACAGIMDITQERPPRNRIAGLLLARLIEGLLAFEREGLSAFLSEWRSLDAFRGQAVRVLQAQGDVFGTALDVSERGTLLVCDEQGQQHEFLSGDVSLRAKNSTKY